MAVADIHDIRVARLHGGLCSGLVLHDAGAGEEEADLHVLFMDVIADAVAGLQRSARKQAALAVHLLRLKDILDLKTSFAAHHALDGAGRICVILNHHFCFLLRLQSGRASCRAFRT